jgi:hypothetical protein
MTSESEPAERVLQSVLAAAAGAATTFVVFALVWTWPLQTVATGLQVLGVGLTLLGVGVVRGWIARTHRATINALAAAKGRMRRSWARRREQLRRWWARKRGKTIPSIVKAGSSSMSGGGNGTLTVEHARINRDVVTDREWLAWLDDRVDLILRRLDEGDKARDDAHGGPEADAPTIAVSAMSMERPIAGNRARPRTLLEHQRSGHLATEKGEQVRHFEAPTGAFVAQYAGRTRVRARDRPYGAQQPRGTPPCGVVASASHRRGVP